MHADIQCKINRTKEINKLFDETTDIKVTIFEADSTIVK